MRTEPDPDRRHVREGFEDGQREGDNWTFDTAGGSNDGFRRTEVDPNRTFLASDLHVP
jgi:hypothetical protein